MWYKIFMVDCWTLVYWRARFLVDPVSELPAPRLVPADTWILIETFSKTHATSSTTASNTLRSCGEIAALPHQERHITIIKMPLLPPRWSTFQSASAGQSRCDGPHPPECQEGWRVSHHSLHSIANSIIFTWGTTLNFFPCPFHHLTSSGRFFEASQFALSYGWGLDSTSMPLNKSGLPSHLGIQAASL